MLRNEMDQKKKRQQEEEELIWKSESPDSMVSVSLGRAITTLLAVPSKKLYHCISRFSLHSDKTPPLASLEDSLWFLHKYINDAAQRNETLDDLLIPIIHHGLTIKDLNRGSQAVILINWLFQEDFIFQVVATDLVNIILRKEDRHIALGWCVLVRNLVEYESLRDKYTLNGIKDNYNSFLKIVCSRLSQLSYIVCRGSTLQDGFELPSRLSVAAADCILSITEALTKESKVTSNKLKSPNPNASDCLLTLVPAANAEKKVKPTCKSAEVVNLEMAHLLWNQIGELIILLQKLLAWSRKSRPLHAKGVEQVIKWLQEINGHYGCNQDDTDATILKTGALLLSSCWKHYSILLHLEDHKFSLLSRELFDQYMSGIQYYTDNHAEGHTENRDGGVETKKFFLNCLCLLLGRFDSKKFETTRSEYGIQISHVLLSQLHCTDEDVVAGAVCIFKAVIFKPNCSSGSSLTDNRQMDAALPVLLGLLDERDGTARAVVMLIAEYCSMSTDTYCLKQVLRLLASGNASQRRNAVDVISELVRISLQSGSKLSHLEWQDIANNLLDCIGDQMIAIREQASNLLSMIDPSFVLPALLHLVYSSVEVQSSATAALSALLKYHNQKAEVICMLLDCLSNLSQSLDLSKTTGESSEGPKLDIDRVLKLIPEWAKTVQDWNSLIGPLIEKMFSEPKNATVVRFLSYISEYLAEASNEVLYKVLLKMKGQEEWENRTYTCEDSVKMQQSLFEHLCPLLIIRLLPLRVFNDLNSPIMYGQLPNPGVARVSENGDISIISHECVTTFLLKRAFSKYEFEDVRKLAAELCGRIHPQVLFPTVSSLLEHAADFQDILKIKACLFSVCTSFVVRGRDSISHPFILEIRKTLERILLWSSIDGDEVSKAQHGCIDCLALMICAELQAPASFKDSSEFSIVGKSSCSGNSAMGNSVLAHVTNHLTNDNNEVVSASVLSSENYIFEASVSSFRLCMANVLISACQKISDSGKKPFAQNTLPCLIHSVEVIRHPESRAACIQVMFSAVYHLKSAVLPYSSDLLKLSLKFLKEGSEKERMAGAKLMASLMASEDVILESISGGLLEARFVLSSISRSDPSPNLQQVCNQLLSCITS